jgi:hypothetical protein
MSEASWAWGRRWRTGIAVWTMFATLVLALPTLAAACIEDGGGEDRGPLIGAAQITPSSFPYSGGTAVVSGEVEDDCGIQRVRAEVASVEGGLAWSFQLLPVKVVNANTVLYSGEIELPPNDLQSTARYLGVLEAEDTNGSIEYAYAGEAEVAAQSGKLTVRPTQRAFGAVRLGGTATRRLIVSNRGRPGTQPIAASITTSGAAFALQEAVDGRVDFLLGPGETRTFAIDFAPLSPGLDVGSAIVSSSDGAQPDVVVSLSGRGVERRRG